MGARAEELQGERGVALIVEAVVEEDVWRAEHDGVAGAGFVRDADQGGEAVARVALVGADVDGGVADAARVGLAGAQGGGQGAVGGSAESRLVAGSATTPGTSRSTDELPGATRTVRPPESAVAECSSVC